MEVVACVKPVSSHAASLLASLNLQRTQAQLCDCVVRQRQNPGRLYPAHRCVLAAASPVLATLLSSTGALVELQAPCISDSVLELLLDYIYTGAFPHLHSQQQYCSLLAATGHLEMEELQEALKHWQQTETDEAIQTTTENDHCRTVSVVNSGNCIQEMPQIPHVHNNQFASGVHTLSRVDKVGQKDERLSDVDFGIKLERPKDEELVRTVVDRRNQCLPNTGENGEEGRTWKSHEAQEPTDKKVKDKAQSSHLSPFSPTDHISSPSSTSQSCGAVPVICHSSRAPMLQMCRKSPYQAPNEASASSRSAPVSRSVSTDSTDGGITPKPSYVRRNPDYRHVKAVESGDGSSGWDRCDAVRQGYNTSDAHRCIVQKDKNMNGVVSHISRHTSHDNSLCSENSTADVYSVVQNSNFSHYKSNLKRKSDPSWVDVPFKSQNLECQEISTVAGEDRSIRIHERRTSFRLPGEDSYTEKDTQFEEYSRSPDETDQRDSHCGPQTGPYSVSHEDIKTKFTASWQCEKDKAATGRGRGADLHTPISTTPESNLHTFTDGITTSGHRIPLELEQILNIEIADTYAFPKPTDSSFSDAKYSDEGTSYRGQLHYHCLPQRDTHSDHKHVSSGQFEPDHSDLSSDGDEFGIVNGSGNKNGFNRGTANQVLLLDISTKPAELLVSYQHGCIEGDEGIAFGEKNTNRNGLECNEPNDAAFLAGKRKMSDDFSPDSFDKTEFWIKEHDVTTGKNQQQRAKIIQRTRSCDVDEVSVGAENSTSKAGTCMPDYAQSALAALSVCVPSGLSHSTPTNVSPHLSSPVHHPFQCTLCDRSFSQRGSLNRHVRSHLGVRPFPCPRCPMTFSRQYRVTEHMRVHERMPLSNDFQKPSPSSI